MITQAKEILEHIKKNGGYSCSDKKVIAFKQEENNLFSKFEGKKIKIKYLHHDWVSSIRTKEGKGKILKTYQGNWIFLPKRNRARGSFITTGLCDGHLYTLTVLEIKEVE